MKRHFARLLVLLSMVVPASTALAQEEAPIEEEAKEQEFDFEGDTVSTDYLKPNALLVEGLRRGRRSSLIQVRLDFVAEILKSAEDI